VESRSGRTGRLRRKVAVVQRDEWVDAMHPEAGDNIACPTRNVELQAEAKPRRKTHAQIAAEVLEWSEARNDGVRGFREEGLYHIHARFAGA